MFIFLLQVLKAEKERQQAAHVKALSGVLEKHDKEQQDMGKQNIFHSFLQTSVTFTIALWNFSKSFQ